MITYGETIDAIRLARGLDINSTTYSVILVNHSSVIYNSAFYWNHINKTLEIPSSMLKDLTYANAVSVYLHVEHMEWVEWDVKVTLEGLMTVNIVILM